MTTMVDVIPQLKTIEAWERSAMPLTLEALAREEIAHLQGPTLRNHREAVSL